MPFSPSPRCWVSGGGQAVAQSYSVSEVTVEIEGWTFAPILKQHNGVETVHSFLCLYDSDLLVGNNLASVWFIRGHDAQGNPDWEAKSWLSQDQWESIAALKAELQMASTWDDRWPTKLPQPQLTYTNPEAPKQYKGGVLEEDPIAPILEATQNPGTVIQALVGIGYPAAEIKVELQLDCPYDVIMEAYASGVEAVDGEQAADLEAGIAAYDVAFFLFGCQRQGCTPSTWTVAGSQTAGDWSCAGWSMIRNIDACPPIPPVVAPPNGGYATAPGTGTCYYCGTATRTESRVRSSRASNCAVTAWTQTRTCTGPATGRSNIEMGQLCPAIPDNADTCTPATYSCTSWAP